MALTTTDQQFIGAEPSLEEPHFDEEATLLSAQPVVPLAAIEATTAKSWFPHPWLLGLGLIGALMIGVFATAMYYSRSKDHSSKTFQDGELVAGVEGESSESINSFSGPTATQPAVEPEVPAEVQTAAAKQPVKTSVELGKKPRPRLVTVIRETNRSNQTEEDILENRRAARREARQERRERRRDSRSSDELLRIRDIFEGSPRPQE